MNARSPNKNTTMTKNRKNKPSGAQKRRKNAVANFERLKLGRIPSSMPSGAQKRRKNAVANFEPSKLGRIPSSMPPIDLDRVVFLGQVFLSRMISFVSALLFWFFRKKEPLRAKDDDLEPIGKPSPLWDFVTDYPDVFEAHVLLSGKLNKSDIKMFYDCCIASRRAVIRAKIKLETTFEVSELSSISTLELAWEGYPWGAMGTLPSGQVITMNQEYFSYRVADTNDLKFLRWVREEKECDWDYKTSGVAACKGNLDMLKYCVENGCEVDDGTCACAAKFGRLDCLEYLRSKKCPWDEQVCELAHEHNHMDILTYAVKNKAPGFEAYEQFIPK